MQFIMLMTLATKWDTFSRKSKIVTMKGHVSAISAEEPRKIVFLL